MNRITMITYTTIQKFGVSNILMFLKEVSYIHQGCIYLIKITVKIVKKKNWNIKKLHYYVSIFENVSYYCNGKADFF